MVLKMRRGVFAVTVVMGLLMGGCSRESEDAAGGAPDSKLPVAGVEGSASGEGIAPATGSSMQFQQPKLTDLDQILSSPNKTGLTSRAVELSNLEVQETLGPWFLLAGRAPNQSVLVRLPEPNPSIRKGARLNVSGLVAQLGSDLAQWEIDQAQVDKVRGHSVFVNATRAETVSR